MLIEESQDQCSPGEKSDLLASSVLGSAILAINRLYELGLGLPAMDRKLSLMTA